MALTSSNLSDTVKTLYEKRLLNRAMPRLIHGKWSSQAKYRGFNAYEVRRWNGLGLVSTPLSEGITPNEQAQPTITVTTITPVWYGTWVKYTDKLDATAFDPFVSETVAILGEQAGLSVDTLLRNSITDGATADYSGGATSRATLDLTNDILSFTDIIQNVAELEAANARPADGPYYPVLIHPHSWATIVQDATFSTLYTREGGESLRSGALGVVLNCRFYMSSNVREYVDAGQNSTEDVYSMLFIGEQAHAVAGFTNLFPNLDADTSAPAVRGGMTGKKVNAVKVILHDLGHGEDPLEQRATIAWKLAFSDAVLNSTWVRNLEHVNDFS